jgi:hypothetical protein
VLELLLHLIVFFGLFEDVSIDSKFTVIKKGLSITKFDLLTIDQLTRKPNQNRKQIDTNSNSYQSQKINKFALKTRQLSIFADHFSKVKSQ